MPKVIIDAMPILKDEPTGIGVYTASLIRELYSLNGRDLGLRLFGNRQLIKYFDSHRHWLPGDEIKKGVYYDIPQDWEFNRYAQWLVQLAVWRSLRPVKAALFHGTSFCLPRSTRKIKKIVTIHDLAFLRIPGIEDEHTAGHVFGLTKHACRKADKIIAVSEATKKDILHFFNVNEKKIAVIYEGVDHKKWHADGQSSLNSGATQKINLPQKYVLFVGTTNRRKNLLSLTKAMSLLRNRDIHLVIVGKPGNQHEAILRFVESKALADRVLFLGYQNDDRLREIYRRANAFIYPSRYEGFGLPVLEAMSCGVPVITSNNSSMSELFQSVALLVDPMDDKALAEAINKIAADDALKNHMIAEGLAFSKQFSWPKMAQETMALYKATI